VSFFCKYTLCKGSLHVACSVQNGKMGLAALVCCDVNVVDRFNFRHQFSLQALLKDKQHFIFVRTGMQQTNT
jgi:hypothetical protein